MLDTNDSFSLTALRSNNNTLFLKTQQSFLSMAIHSTVLVKLVLVACVRKLFLSSADRKRAAINTKSFILEVEKHAIRSMYNSQQLS